MGGVWVFPGGAVDDSDMAEGTHDAAMTAPASAPRAARELREEAGIALADTGGLVEFSRWITPAQVRTRFDTHFFLVALPAGQEPRDRRRGVRGARLVHAPGRARRPRAPGEIVLVFPTIKHLEQLGGFASVEALLAHARGRDVRAGRAPGRARGRGRPRAAPGRSRLLISACADQRCWASITCVTALISARWVNACG